MSSSGGRKKGRTEDEEASSKPEGPQKGSSWHDRSSSSASRAGAKAGPRSSKHAPTEMSSKRAVSRWREVVAVPKIAARDPRFDPLTGPAPDEAKMRKNYAFLDEYRDDEMRQLKVLLKQDGKGKGKGKKGGAVALAPEERAELQRSLRSMESRKKADVRKAQEREVLAEHRRQEKELVRQGKQPFYLKKAEQKKRLLMDQFAGMKKREVDKAMERKRKKMAGKEKKELPFARRGA
ncbi:MAG: rRNA biogenesis protein RRP36, partial [Thaumarchaeota archaeon]|nr:rRNA biogenesis protein RRP36 [Nitrososphaerota archaeon]